MLNLPTDRPLSVDAAKTQARRLAKAVGNGTSHSQALEIVAKTHGFRSWGEMSGLLASETPVKRDDPKPVISDSLLFFLEDLIVNMQGMGPDERDDDEAVWERRHIIQTCFHKLSPTGLSNMFLWRHILSEIADFTKNDQGVMDVATQAYAKMIKAYTHAQVYVPSMPSPDYARSVLQHFQQHPRLPTHGPLTPALLGKAHAFACVSDRDALHAKLVDGGNEVVDFGPRFDPYYLMDLLGVDAYGKNFINPLQALLRCAGRRARFGFEEAVFLIPSAELSKVSGDLLLAMVRSLGVYVVVVGDSHVSDEFTKLMAQNVRHLILD